VPCIPMLRDCPLCLLGNSQAMPSYRWSIRQAVGDLPPSSRSKGGGGGHSGRDLFNFFLCLISLLPLPNIPLWPPGPWTPEPQAPSRLLKAQGSWPLCHAFPCLGTAPSAYSATCRPRHLIGSQSGGQLKTCPQAGEAREGGEGHSGCDIFNFFLCLISLPPPPNVPLWPPGPWTPEP